MESEQEKGQSGLDELIGAPDEQEEKSYIEQLAKKRSEDVYKKYAITEKLASSNAISIGPLNTIPQKKQKRKEERRLTTGKGW